MNKKDKDDNNSPSRSKGGSPEISVLIHSKKNANSSTAPILEDSMNITKKTDQTKGSRSPNGKESAHSRSILKPCRSISLIQ